MATKRANKIIVSGGYKNSGKTYQTYKIINDYVNPKGGYTARKVLIFDANQEYTTGSVLSAGFNFSIKTIQLKHVPLFIKHPKIEVCRVVPIKDSGVLMSIKEKKETAWKMLETFRGGLLVLDDINTYALDVTHEEEFVGSVVNSGHRDVDIILNFQNLNMCNPVLIRNFDEARLHHQTENVKEAKFEDRWEAYMIAQKIVDLKVDSGQPKYCLYIDNHSKKIRGNFSKKDFALACYDYMSRYNPRLIKQEQTRLKTKDQATAAAEAIKGLFKYYGNPN